MIAFVLSLWANKFARYGLVALGVVLLLGGGVLYVKHRIHQHDAAIVAAEQRRVSDANLKETVVVQAAQATIRTDDATALRQETTQTASKVTQAQATIHAEVASGALPNTQISATRMATIDSIEAMEADRLKDEAQ